MKLEALRDNCERGDVIGQANLMFDLTAFAFCAESTLFITIMMDGFIITLPIESLDEGHDTHSLHRQGAKKLHGSHKSTASTSICPESSSVPHKTARNAAKSRWLSTVVFYGTNNGQRLAAALRQCAFWG